MKLLFDDQLAPITSSIGFLQCRAQKVKDVYVEWQSTIQVKRGVSLNVRTSRGELRELLRGLLPLTSVERRRMLFVQTVGEWTAFFDNGWKGTDVFSTGAFLAKKIGCRGVRAVCVPGTLEKETEKKGGRYGATMFELYSAHQTDFLNIERAISAANDGGKWVFSANGTQQPFEDVSRYTARSVVDRFTPEMLDQYLQALGIRAFDAGFYVSPGGAFLVEKTGPSAPGMSTYSLDAVRARWGAT